MIFFAFFPFRKIVSKFIYRKGDLEIDYFPMNYRVLQKTQIRILDKANPIFIPF